MLPAIYLAAAALLHLFALKALPATVPSQVAELIPTLLIVGFPLVVVYARKAARRQALQTAASNQASRQGWWSSRHVDFLIMGLSLALLLYIAMDQFAVIPSSESLGKGPEVVTNDDFKGIMVEQSLAILELAQQDTAAEIFLAQVFAELLYDRVKTIPGLELAARASVAVLNSETATTEISEALGVAWLLAGKISGQDGNLRIDIELLSGSDAQSHWSLGDSATPAGLARVAEQAVQAVKDVLALEQHGSVSARAPDPAPDMPLDLALDLPLDLNGPLHNRYHQAVQLARQGPAALSRAGSILEEVVRLAPQSGKAWAALAQISFDRAMTTVPPSGDAVTLSYQAVRRAIELNPELADGWVVLGQLLAYGEWDWSGADEAYATALNLAPSDILAIVGSASVKLALGEFDQAQSLWSRAIRLDRMNLAHRLRLGMAQEFDGQYKQAISTYRQLMVNEPDYPGAHVFLGRALIADERARSGLLHMQLEKSPFWASYGQLLALTALGRTEKAHTLLAQFKTDHGAEAAFQIAEIHALANEPDLAFEWLSRAVDQRDPGLAWMLGNPFLTSIRQDSRWDAHLLKVGLPIQ